jgi:hypothetical protein
MKPINKNTAMSKYLYYLRRATDFSLRESQREYAKSFCWGYNNGGSKILTDIYAPREKGVVKRTAFRRGAKYGEVVHGASKLKQQPST